MNLYKLSIEGGGYYVASSIQFLTTKRKEWQRLLRAQTTRNRRHQFSREAKQHPFRPIQ